MKDSETISLLLSSICAVASSAAFLWAMVENNKLVAKLKHNNIMRLQLIVDLAVMKEDYETAVMASEMIKQLEGKR